MRSEAAEESPVTKPRRFKKPPVGRCSLYVDLDRVAKKAYLGGEEGAEKWPSKRKSVPHCNDGSYGILRASAQKVSALALGCGACGSLRKYWLWAVGVREFLRIGRG